MVPDGLLTVANYLAKMPNSMGHTMNPEAYKQKAMVIKAMAHPSRLLMLDALAEGEKCVCELQRLVGSDLSTVSKHLSVMKNAGLVADRKEGLQVYYRLRVPCVLRFFDCVEAVLRENSAAAARALRE
jgi:ArsR family transcriptional regulator